MRTARCTATLLDDRGLEPIRELRELQAAILRQDPSLDLTGPAPAFPPELQAAAAAPMFGRARELAWLWERWTAVYDSGTRRGRGGRPAPPGIGKTRLLAALAARGARRGCDGSSTARPPRCGRATPRWWSSTTRRRARCPPRRARCWW